MKELSLYKKKKKPPFIDCVVSLVGLISGVFRDELSANKFNESLNNIDYEL